MLEHATTGDGVLTSLQLLAAVNRHGVPLAAAAQMMPKYPRQALVNVPGDASQLGPEVAAAVRRAEAELGGSGRNLGLAERDRARDPIDDPGQGREPGGTRHRPGG